MTVPFNKSRLCFCGCFWILLLLLLPPAEAVQAQEVEEEDLCDLHDLSDGALFHRAFNRTLGDCIIHLGDTSSFCDFYVKGKPRDSSGSGSISDYKGIPLSTSGLGSGCVSSLCPECSAESTGGYSGCWYSDPSYPLTTNERASMCTTSIVSNAAAQIRYGIRYGFCFNQVCSSITNNPTPAPSTAPTSGTANVIDSIQWEETKELVLELGFDNWPFHIIKIAANADCTRMVLFLEYDFISDDPPNPRIFSLVNETSWESTPIYLPEAAPFSFSTGTSEYIAFTPLSLSGDGGYIAGHCQGDISCSVQVYDIDSSSNISIAPKRRWTEEDSSLSEVPLKEEPIKLSHDGKRIVFKVEREKWDGFQWVKQQGSWFRVHEWNGTTYRQIGETIFSSFHIPRHDTPYKFKNLELQMDKTGSSLFLANETTTTSGQASWELIRYQFNVTNNRWEPVGNSLPLGYASPDGSRVAVLGVDDVRIFQFDDIVTKRWNEVSSVQVDRGETQRSGFGFDSFVWMDDAGASFAVGDTSEQEVGPPTDEPVIGAIYVFQQNECAQKEGAAAAVYYCTFNQLGKVIRTSFVRHNVFRGSPDGSVIRYLKPGNENQKSTPSVWSIRRVRPNNNSTGGQSATSVVRQGSLRYMNNPDLYIP